MGIMRVIQEKWIKFRVKTTLESWLKIHTTAGQSAGWRIVAGICPLIAGPLRRLLNFEEDKLQGSPGWLANTVLAQWLPGFRVI